jgi:hypothetical protein
VADAETLTKEMSTSYTLQAETFGKAMGSLLMIRPRVLGSYGLELDHKKRTVPIDLRETEQGTDEYEITLPAGYVIDEVPEPVKLDVGFASYVSKSEMKGNVLHYTRKFIVTQPVIPAEKYPDLQKLAETVGADEQSRAVLKRQ